MTHIGATALHVANHRANPDTAIAASPTTFIEHTHRLIDYLHSYRIREKPWLAEHKQRLELFRNTTSSIHIYESIVVFERDMQLAQPPAQIKVGKVSIPYIVQPFQGTYFNYSELKWGKNGSPALFSFL